MGRLNQYLVSIESPSDGTRAMGHLADINKSYFSHLFGAWKMAFWFTLGGFRLIIHGIIPNFDIRAGQDTVDRYAPSSDGLEPSS